MGSANADGKVLNFYHIAPIGSVVAWLKSYTNTPALPEGWKECDGSTISDADSPYNTQALPNLNGSTEAAKRFLRGSTTSGTTGVQTAHSHTADAFNGGFQSGSDRVANVIQETVPIVPPYYEVVWIMRIK